MFRINLHGAVTTVAPSQVFESQFAKPLKSVLSSQYSYSLIPGAFPCFILIRLNSARSIVKTVDAFEADIVNFLTASSVLEATLEATSASATSATLAQSSFAISTVTAAASASGWPVLANGGANDALLLLLRGEDGEWDLSGAGGGFSEAAFFLDAGEDRGCFVVTLSFWNETFC